jgi:hypothetical protein
MNRLSIKQKPAKLFIVIFLAVMISSLLTLPYKATAQTDGYYNKSFAWDYAGRHWTWNLSIPQALYEDYKSVPVSARTHDGPAGYGFCTTTKDPYIEVLALKLNDTANQLGYNSFDRVSFVLAFVQSLPYTSDSVTTGHDEYPRFPIETLVDDGGDCEDTSILFATLTLVMGYGTVYINPPDHYAVGVLGNNLHGTYWTYPSDSNKTYYYCETTGDGFKIGQLPEEFSGQKAFIYPIDESLQYVSMVDVSQPIDSTPQPTDALSITTHPTPSETPNPTTTETTSPSITQPSIQPVRPLSFNLISDNPAFFVIVVFAIVASIMLAVWPIRKPNLNHLEQPIHSETNVLSNESATSEATKHCIYCGSSNKAHANYCESCGKQTGN